MTVNISNAVNMMTMNAVSLRSVDMVAPSCGGRRGMLVHTQASKARSASIGEQVRKCFKGV